MLEGINHAILLLKEIRSFQATQIAYSQYNEHDFRFTSRPYNAGPQSDATGVADSQIHQSAFTGHGFTRLEVSENAAKASCCESILRWPSISETAQCGEITSFPLLSVGSSPNDGASGEASSRSYRAGGLIEDNIYPLCKTFILQIHIKNPVLNVQEFLMSAREVSEKGPGWDGQGCLALLACALAGVATPFRYYHRDNTTSTPQDHNLLSTPPDSQVQISMSEPYFMAAKRRLGLLDTSLLCVQCLFFAGVYEKFVMRPLAAWKFFQRACVEMQTYLHTMALKSSSASGHERALHLEQRLYWACMSSECELRAELQLPASGLTFKYPDIFPSLSLPGTSAYTTARPPPTEMTWESPCGSMTQTSPASVTSLEPAEEISWLHYLAEISLRKIMNQILESVFGHGEEYWLRHICEVSQRLANLKEDLESWRVHLPAALQFYDEGIPNNEFALLLKTRWLSCWDWVHRPFLYFIIHSAEPVNIDTERQTILSLAQECLRACAELIPLIAEHHRHGGVWVLLRRTFGCAIMIIAACASTSLDLQVAQTQHLVDMALKTISRWSYGSTELKWMEKTLTKIAVDFGLSSAEAAGL